MPLNVATLIYFIVEILLYLFHFSVLILLISRRNSTFDGPFFKILRIVFVMDLMCFLMAILIQKMSLIEFLIPFYKSNTYLAYFCFNATAYFTIVQFFGHLLMAFNRFSLIWFPLKYNSLWKRQWYTFMLIFSPILLLCWRLHEPAIFLYLSDTNVTTALINSSVMALNYLILTSFYLLTTFFAAIFNVFSFTKFYFHKHTASDLNVNERNLLVMSFITMLAQLLRISYAANKLIFPPEAAITLFFNSILSLLLDIFALSGSVSLLVLSSTTRNEYKLFYIFKTVSPIQIMATSSVQRVQSAIKT